jgi:hypothetical protein
MAKKQSSQYTIREVPPELDKLLRKNARDEQLSLNQVIIKALEDRFVVAKTPLYNDLDFCINSWTSESEVDEALRDQRKK